MRGLCLWLRIAIFHIKVTDRVSNSISWLTRRLIHWHTPVAYPAIFFRGGGGSTNSAEDRGQTEQGSGGSSPLVRGSTQSANEWNPYSNEVVTDAYSTEMGSQLSFVKTSEFRVGGGGPFSTLLAHTTKQCTRNYCCSHVHTSTV
jgi:hypothetical protein